MKQWICQAANLNCRDRQKGLTPHIMRRLLEKGASEYVFPGRGGKGHIVDSDHVIRGVANEAKCPFMLHDLRRTFLTMAERLGFSYVILKKLANHSGRNDTTFGYIVVDIE